MNSALNLLVVDGKKIINTATVPAGEKSQPVHIKAIDGAKYLLSSGDNQAAPEHMVVKRVGQDLQIFTADGDTTPSLIVDGFYQHQGELSGMAADGTYHTYVNQDGSDRDAFLLLDDNGTSTLILGDATSGLEGLAVDSGLSTAVIAVGALAALAALAGVVMSRNNHPGDHNVTPAAPTGSEATDNVGTVQGKIVSGSVTDDTRPVLTGTAAPNSVIRIYDNGVLIGSARAAEDGSWQFQPAHALSEGSHSLTSSAAYGKFESAQSAPIGFTVDTTPPDVPHPGSLTDGNGKDLTTGGLTNNGNLNMSGRGVPGDVVKVWEGDTLIGSGVVGADGNWSVPVVIDGDREHDLSASFTDPAGNESAKSAPIAVDLDTTPPGIPDVGDLTDGNGQDLSTGGLTNNGELVMAGSGAVPGDTVKIWDGETVIGSGIVGPDGNWSVPVVVDGDGEHDLSASFNDPAGNEGAKSAPIAVDLDTTPPEAPTAGELSDGNGQDLSAGGLTNSGEMNMSGTGGTAGDVVSLYDGDTLIGTAVVQPDGSWTLPAEISGDRTHDLSTSYTDPAGNESARSAPIAVDLDTTPPDAPAAGELTDGNSQDLSHGGLTNSGEMNMSGSGGVAGDTVNLYDGDTLIGTATVGADGNWSIPAEISGDRAHDLSTSYTDPAGNEGARSAPIVVDLDTTPPDAPTAGALTDGHSHDLSRGGLTNSGEMNMSGTGGVAGDTVNLYDGDMLIGTATVGADGSWSIPAEISGDRIHDLSTSYTDPAGNESTRSAPVAVNLDTTPPDAPAAGTLNDGNGLNLSAGGLTNNGSLTMSGSGGTRGDIVKLYDGSTLIGSATVNADGSWTIPGAISGDHAHNLSTSYTDPAGNESTHSAPVTVNLDTTAPTTTLVLNDNTPSLSGHTEANALVMIYNGTELVGSQRANGSGDWSWRPTGTLADATYHFNATAQDSLGNVSRHTANLDFRVATTVNDFNDTTGQGWTLEGPLAGGAVFNGANLRIVPDASGNPAGDLMTRSMSVVAGHTYNFSVTGQAFITGGIEQTFLSLGLKIDGVALGATQVMVNNTMRFSWTATHTGVVDLTMFTDTTHYISGNWMWLDDFTVRDSAPTGATSVSSMGIESDDSVAQHHDDAISSMSAHHDVSSVAAQPEAAPVASAQHDDGANPLQLSGNQLHLTDSSPVIDLTHVVAQHQGEEVHSVSLEGHGNNTLNVSINDVLALGSEDLFQQDGNKQLLIKGDAGDVVNLESINGEHAPEQWNAQGQVTHDGTTYNVYQSVDHEVEVLIQQGVQTHLQ